MSKNLDIAEPAVSEYDKEEESLGLSIKDIESMEKMQVADMKSYFTPVELLLIVAMTNGWIIDLSAVEKDCIEASLSDFLYYSRDECMIIIGNENLEAVMIKLIEKITTLGRFERFSLLRWAKRFWLLKSTNFFDYVTKEEI